MVAPASDEERPPVSLLAKDTIATDTGLERRAAILAARELLTTTKSKTIDALTDELKATKLIALTTAEVRELLAELLP